MSIIDLARISLKIQVNNVKNDDMWSLFVDGDSHVADTRL